jgi:hypothetical protein
MSQREIRINYAFDYQNQISRMILKKVKRGERKEDTVEKMMKNYFYK